LLQLFYILIIVQRDATQSCLFITLQVHSTCLGCQPHPSSEVHKNPTWPTWPLWSEVASQRETALCCISLDNY